MNIPKTITKHLNSLFIFNNKYIIFEDALKNGEENDAIALLDTTYDVNKVSLSGTSFLMIAANKNYTKLFRALIDKGADVHAVSSNDTTALTYAAENANIEAVTILLQQKVALHHKHTVSYLLKHSNIFGGSSDINEALANYHSNTDTVEFDAKELLSILMKYYQDNSFSSQVLKSLVDSGLIEKINADLGESKTLFLQNLTSNPTQAKLFMKLVQHGASLDYTESSGKEPLVKFALSMHQDGSNNDYIEEMKGSSLKDSCGFQIVEAADKIFSNLPTNSLKYMSSLKSFEIEFHASHSIDLNQLPGCEAYHSEDHSA